MCIESAAVWSLNEVSLMFWVGDTKVRNFMGDIWQPTLQSFNVLGPVVQEIHTKQNRNTKTAKFYSLSLIGGLY